MKRCRLDLWLIYDPDKDFDLAERFMRDVVQWVEKNSNTATIAGGVVKVEDDDTSNANTESE